MDERLDFMKYLASEAGRIIMKYRDPNVKYKLKKDNSIVTVADLQVSEFIQAEIPKRFPDDGILDEEAMQNSIDRLTKNGTWIIDPLDGSGDFKGGGEDFCFLGAYAEKGVPIIGVVYEPSKDRMFFAHKGSGAYLTEKGLTENEKTTKLKPLEHISWNKSIVGHPKNYKGDRYTKLYGLLGIPKERLEVAGSMGIRMMHAALQQTHMILGYTQGLKEWDVAAGHVILNEIGVSVTNIFGEPLKYNQENPKMDKGILVVHPDIKKETLERLAECYTQLKV